ncbi:MAG: hypothetical protein QW153_02830 [Candidatus Bilamarchaeaceae archaeon]
MKNKIIGILVIIAGLLNAALVISGDAGISFAKNKSTEMCNDPRVSEVFICSGNVVKVVWADIGKGSTFFVPDGRVVDCITLEPGKTSAACVQFSIPNYCTQKVECSKEEKKATEEKEKVTIIEETKNESKKIEESIENKITPPKKENQTIVIPFDRTAEKNKEESSNFLTPITIAVVAMIAVLLALYYIFKKTVIKN